MKNLFQLCLMLLTAASLQAQTADFSLTAPFTHASNTIGSNTEARDYDVDGNPDRIDTYTYDANGNLLTETFDTDADGDPNEIYTYTYDANGNQLTYTYDRPSGGTPYWIYTSTYDANGNRLTWAYDATNGTPDWIYTYTYDANGNRLTETCAANAGGTPYWIYTYTYDANGNRLTEGYDSNGDGTPNKIITYTYDANGNRLTEGHDSNLDGTPDLIYTYTYDANGNTLSETYDGDGDGTPELIDTYTYTYDANGNLLTETADWGADGTTNLISTYTYDANGNLLTKTHVGGSGGTPDLIYTYTYDANGNLLTAAFDLDGNGNPNQIYTYTYALEFNTCTLLGQSLDKIYTVTIPHNGDWRFSLCNSAYNTKLFVGTTMCTADIGSNDDACGTASEVITSALPAGTYYVTIGGSGASDKGNYELSVDNANSIEQTNPSAILLDAFPNPFSNALTITVDLAEANDVTANIYNLQGSLIYTLFDGQLNAGKHNFNWDATNNKGETIPAGYYLCQLQIGAEKRMQPIICIK